MPADLPRTPIIVGTAALVVAVAGSALAAVAAKQLSQSDERGSRRAQALAAGEQIAVDFSAYDYRHLQQDFDRVINDATGQFKATFQQSSAGVQDIIIKVKAVSTAEVASASIVTVHPSDATVIVALNRTVKNTSSPNGQSDSLRVQITLRRVHGRWLASAVKPL